MNPVVAVIAPGMMGAAVGGRLAAHGLKVLTSLTGRSAETMERAKAAGLSAASDEEIAAADFILSILPPGDAVELAQRFAPALTASNAKPVYRRLQRRSARRPPNRSPRWSRRPARRSSTPASSARRRPRRRARARDSTPPGRRRARFAELEELRPRRARARRAR